MASSPTPTPTPEWRAQAKNAPPRPGIPYSGEPVYWEALFCTPHIAPTAWVAPGAVVLGRVRLKARSSVWFGCVLRGDEEYIEVGEESNVQDGSVLHIDSGLPCLLGDRVTVGHRAVVHASTVHDDVLIGMGATVLSGCVIGEGALIAAGALLREGTEVPPRTLWAGCPAKPLKTLNAEQSQRMVQTCRIYANSAQAYLARYGRAHMDALRAGTL